jgi:hypothetical protein
MTSFCGAEKDIQSSSFFQEDTGIRFQARVWNGTASLPDILDKFG